MRIAIFSDVHGNIYSFEKIIQSIKREKVDAFIFCGDICGYYYYQNEIINILKEMKDLYCVLGNHDKFFLDFIQDKTKNKLYYENYGKSMELLSESISKENIKFLKSLKHKQELLFGKYKMGVFHGSPCNFLEGYIYPDTSVEKYKELNYDYIILGHTHYQMLRKIDNKFIINPGSCGQPRDGNYPSYAILDLKKKKIKFVNIEYDFEPLLRDIKKNEDTNKYLTDILYRGREGI